MIEFNSRESTVDVNRPAAPWLRPGGHGRWSIGGVIKRADLGAWGLAARPRHI